MSKEQSSLFFRLRDTQGFGKGVLIFKSLRYPFLKFETAINILVQLKRKDIIGMEKAKDALNKLEEFGWYDSVIIKEAIGDLSEG